MIETVGAIWFFFVALILLAFVSGTFWIHQQRKKTSFLRSILKKQHPKEWEEEDPSRFYTMIENLQLVIAKDPKEVIVRLFVSGPHGNPTIAIFEGRRISRLYSRVKQITTRRAQRRAKAEAREMARHEKALRRLGPRLKTA